MVIDLFSNGFRIKTHWIKCVFIVACSRFECHPHLFLLAPQSKILPLFIQQTQLSSFRTMGFGGFSFSTDLPAMISRYFVSGRVAFGREQGEGFDPLTDANGGPPARKINSNNGEGSAGRCSCVTCLQRRLEEGRD
jgi:hypothetical protein